MDLRHNKSIKLANFDLARFCQLYSLSDPTKMLGQKWRWFEKFMYSQLFDFIDTWIP